MTSFESLRREVRGMRGAGRSVSSPVGLESEFFGLIVAQGQRQ